MKTNHQKTILIVEDEKLMLNALREEFVREGFIVLEAQDGEDGLAKALENQPDAIVLDIVMPRMNGLVMLMKLRADRRGKNIPVIFLTNVKDQAKEREAINNNVSEYLVKSDWSLEDVILKVKQAM